MNGHPIKNLLERDRRYSIEGYEFVRDALAYAQEVLGLGQPETERPATDDPQSERHLTGQELCEASRRLALDQYGMMAKVVLNSWGIHTTGDLGEIVYNLIGVDLMRKSPTDRREDFNDVFDFQQAFHDRFDFQKATRIRRDIQET